MGETLRKRREAMSMSTIQAAQRADVSTAYLSKLERGEVRQPSPHILHRLSSVLEIPYEELMILAGYLVPSTTSSRMPSHAAALFGEDLTEEETEMLLDYLAWYRQRKRKASRSGAREP